MASNIPVIVQGNSFSLAIPLQIYYINGDQMDLEDYTPDPTDEVSVQLKGSRRNYTYTPTIDGNVANIDLTGNELADNYGVVVSVVKANGQRLRSFRTDQFFIVESSDDLTPSDIIEGLEENVIYLNSSIFVAGEDGRGIVDIQKTSTQGLVDTYTIYYTDNTTSTYTITNGAQGEAGATIASVEKTATVGKVDTYTITMTDGNTFDFEVTNGLDGVDLGLANIVNDLTTGGEGNALSAEMGKVLKNYITVTEEISGTWRQGSIGTNYAYKSNMNNRIVMALPTSNPISFNVTSGYYAICHFFSVEYTDIILDTAGTGYIGQESHGWQDGNNITITPPSNSKTTIIILKKGSAGTTNFTPTEGDTAIPEINEHTIVTQIVTEQVEQISSLDTRVDALEESGLNELFLGTLVQKALTATGLNDSDERVSMATNMVLPKEGAKLTFKMPRPYACGIRSANDPRNLSHNNYWYFGGDAFTFPAGDIYFRLCFGKIARSGSSWVLVDEITVAEVEQLLSDGDIRIFVDTDKEGIVERNVDNEKYIKAVMRPFVSGYANNGDLNKLPIFGHTSDVHGDANRLKSFAEFCDYIKVDAGLLSGDLVAYAPVDSMQYVNDIADGCSTMLLPCVGNHDAKGLSTDQTQNALFSYLYSKYSVSTNSQVTYPTYFYKDISSKNIRIISLNIYENSHTNDNCHFSQTQCEWFIATLASTPANYGVLVMFHAPEAKPSKDDSHSAFYQDILNFTGYQDGLTGNVFRTIIDAFIDKTSASITYTSKSTSITVSADFTSVASGVEFIAFVNGHLHADLVGYVNGASNLQLNLNVCTTNALYGPTSYYGNTNLSDMPRGGSGSTQDCFNIYAIDRVAKTVRIARVGSNIAGNLTERKYIIIPYAD